MLTERTEVDKVEVVGQFSHLQVRTATVIERDGTEISRSFHRHVVTPGQDVSNEDLKVQAMAEILHTPEVVQAY